MNKYEMQWFVVYILFYNSWLVSAIEQQWLESARNCIKQDSLNQELVSAIYMWAKTSVPALNKEIIFLLTVETGYKC